ncbi:transporter substrate-binding domain-containing protein [Acinetobacter sp. c3-l95]|uniref:transporter substrate-binding domain-containing protein n=1 Tax=Acinetobacter sp. c3-l95 TaxID=3342804 RepID=UPI0035B7B159
MQKYLAVLVSLCLMTACSQEANKGTTNGDNKVPASTAQQASTAAVATKQNPDYPTYLVGSEVTYPPFSFQDNNGKPTGFEVELLNAIGEAEKFNVTFVNTPRSEVTNTLNNGRFSIWASALSASPERAAEMDFTQPYLEFTRDIYIVDKPENATIHSVDQLKGKKIAVSGSSKSSIELATKVTGSADNIVKSESFFLSLQSTYLGKSDGTIGDSRILQYYQLKHPEIKMRKIALNEPKKEIAFAVKKGNTELTTKINKGLATIKSNGTYDKLVEKWFGKTQS